MVVSKLTNDTNLTSQLLCENNMKKAFNSYTQKARAV